MIYYQLNKEGREKVQQFLIEHNKPSYDSCVDEYERLAVNNANGRIGDETLQSRISLKDKNGSLQELRFNHEDFDIGTIDNRLYSLLEYLGSCANLEDASDFVDFVEEAMSAKDDRRYWVKEHAKIVDYETNKELSAEERERIFNAWLDSRR